MEKDVWVFIDDMISQINPVNDFGLVARSHQDKAWQDAFKKGKLHSKMKEEDIIRDYKEYVREQINRLKVKLINSNVSIEQANACSFFCFDKTDGSV